MNAPPAQITLAEWDRRYAELLAQGLREPSYGGPLRRHVAGGDFRLLKLRIRQLARGPAAVELPAHRRGPLAAGPRDGQQDRRHDEGPGHGAGDGLFAGERDRLLSRRRVVDSLRHGAGHGGDLEHRRSAGHRRIVLPGARDARGVSRRGAFPVAGSLGVQRRGDLRRFLGHRPAAGGLGFPILWWEIPHRRRADAGEAAVELPGGLRAPASAGRPRAIGARARRPGRSKRCAGNG